MFNYINSLTHYEIIFLIIGFLGQGIFASRFVIQWIYSEKKGESSIPIAFWHLSIFGGIGIIICGTRTKVGVSYYRSPTS